MRLNCDACWMVLYFQGILILFKVVRSPYFNAFRVQGIYIVLRDDKKRESYKILKKKKKTKKNRTKKMIYIECSSYLFLLLYLNYPSVACDNNTSKTTISNTSLVKFLLRWRRFTFSVNDGEL